MIRSMEEKDTQRKPLRLRQRPDIQVESRWVGASMEHYLFDPIALEHYRLLDEEYFLWKQLNGIASLLQIREAFENTIRVRESQFKNSFD